jgi:CubicO group peptidase (beta-lactamase class C family)
MAIEGLGQAVGDDALFLFAEEHLAPNFRASLSRKSLIQLLSDIRRYAAMAGGIQVTGSPEGYRIGFRGPESADILVQIENQPPYHITSLKLDTDIEEAEGTEIEPIGWDNLEERLAQEEEAGFAGTVLVVRDGDVVLDRGYGLASRAQGISNTSETIFDIGSTPISFTRAAVLKLVDLGILELDAPISRYLPDVPHDKAGITINHLMSGESGLTNFHHIPGVDDDYDLSYIDRGEAIRRILGQQLLLQPGESRAHSHSAFGLLAAIIEIVSGDSYRDFLATHFLEPAGMFQTGFYGDTRFAEEVYAVGYGSSSVGRINIPMHWGPTSWLVMGGGGMVSNPSDLRRFIEYIREGGLSDAARETFFVNGVLAGGTDRGFLCMLSDVADTTFFVCSNAHEQEGDRAMAVARALATMVRGGE